jgi:predicted methyltransferase
MHNLEKVYLRFADGYYKKTVDERLANNRLPNTVNYLAEYDALGLDNELDLAFWGNNFHDYYYHDEGEASSLEVLNNVYKTLKPGGIFGVMDHVGTGEYDNSKLHRIEPTIIREQLIEAGFVIDSESDLYRNPEDDHSLMVYNDEIYLKTDRVMIKAVKPK